jgi:hypothetical protein
MAGERGVAAGITKELGKALFDLQKVNQVVRGGHWEIVSHSLLSLENRLVVSFLLRRPVHKIWFC